VWSVGPLGELKAVDRLPTRTVLARALSGLRGPEALQAAIGGLLRGWPRAKAELSELGELGATDALATYLQELDGSRPGLDVLDFAPGDRAQVLTCLWLASGLGLLEDRREDGFLTPSPPPTASAAVVSPPSGAGAGRLDEGPSHVVAGLPGRRGASAAPTSAVPAVPVAVEKHPMEDRLRELHRRFTTANHYFDAYGLSSDAPADHFRKCHLEFAQALHPDKYVEASPELQELATEAFDRERVAWETLGDDEKRLAYADRVIRGVKTEEELAMEQVQNYWSAEADFKRGVAALNAGRLLQAHPMFQAAVERVPDELEFRAYLGFTTFQVNRSRDKEAAERGVEMLKDVIERNKEQERKLDLAWVLLGRTYKDAGNDTAAKRCFVQALKLNPANADGLRELKRLSGQEPGRKDEPKAEKRDEAKTEKKGFFASLFGKK
jgi:tetratricopeptide (TPR) repeat protein